MTNITFFDAVALLTWTAAFIIHLNIHLRKLVDNIYCLLEKQI